MPDNMGDSPWADKRVLLAGLGTRGGGEGAARYLRSKGALVTVVDEANPDVLAHVVARLGAPDDGLPPIDSDAIGMPFMEIDVEGGGWDVVVRNPSIPNDDDFLERVRCAGIPIHTEATIFVADHGGPIFGITGTKGKTSAAFWLHHLLDKAGRAPIVAGNMGGSALDALRDAPPDAPAVFEFSSFQIETMGERGYTVDIACLTNLLKDHLNVYGTLERYHAAKAPLFHLQPETGWRVHPAIGLPDGYMDGVASQWFAIGSGAPHATGAEGAAWIDDDQVWLRWDGSHTHVISCDEIPVHDAFRLDSALCAVAAATIAGIDLESLRAGLATLPQIPHRMEPIAIVDERTTWVNDTAATNPEAAKAAIESRSKDGNLTILCGGANKRLDLDPLVAALLAHRPHVVLLPGADSHALAARLADRLPFFGPTATMAEAVELAAQTDATTVLLSPGCASFARGGHPGFDDEFDRGRRFIAAVYATFGLPVAREHFEQWAKPRRAPVPPVEVATPPGGR